VPNPPLNPTDILRRRFADGRLHHAVLLQGKNNPQLVESSLLLIRDLLDMREDQDEHPDLFHLRPSGKARIITVDKTRELIGALNRTSNQGGAKVALIHEVDRMRKEAANAFLKTLEEPPPGTYLILLTTRPYSLLPTIRSRCLLARIPATSAFEAPENWDDWSSRYQSWILSLLDRESLKNDRVSPLFTAYGLTSSLLSLISEQADLSARGAKNSSPFMEDKERDALEAGIRRGVRSSLLAEVAEITRQTVITAKNTPHLSKLGVKLARVLSCLEKNVGLMEVNLKDEAAMENFYLSSLRIWSAK
jgi:DNA polymerase-3 subunit delta'